MKKFFSAIISIISLIIFVISLFVIKAVLRNNNLIDVLSTGDYVDSFDFLEKTGNNINNLFEYLKLENIFETDNEFDENKVIAYSDIANEEDENFKKSYVVNILGKKKFKWTLGYIIEKAGYYGIYIDDKWNVLQYDNYKGLNRNLHENAVYEFFDKVYIDKNNINQSDIMYEVDFIKEVYVYLADYYRYRHYFNNTNFKYIIGFFADDGRYKIYSNTDKTIDEIKNNKSYIYATTIENIIQTNIDIDTSGIFNQLISRNVFDSTKAYMCVMIDTDFLVDDNYKEAYSALDKDKTLNAVVATVMVISFASCIIFLILFIKEICSVKTQLTTEYKKYIPIEIIFTFMAFLCCMSIYFVKSLFDVKFILGTNFENLYKYVYITVIYIFVMFFVLYVSFQLRIGYFESDIFKNSIIGSAILNIKNIMKNFSPKIVYMTLLLPITLLFILAVYTVYYYMKTNYIEVFFIGIMLIIVSSLISVYLWLLNNAYVHSVEEQVKESNTKAALITNVSHDIRTPLTSIINYSDLMKKSIENNNDDKEQLLHFANVLNEKSVKLKFLLDELILASKASSHNIDLHFMDINVKEFIEQVVIEFNDKFLEKQLTVVNNFKGKNMIINVDNNELYRVFQNLFSNIYKYALPNTRVYIDIAEKRTTLIITIKNISKDTLTVKGEELTERFVKGDDSRNSEGFGLGLSIARDLVQAMNGKFKISIDGDLFRAEMIFYKVKKDDNQFI